MANHPKVVEALEKVFDELMKMPTEEFKALIEKNRFHSWMEDVLAGKILDEKLEETFDAAIDGWHNTMGHYYFEEISLENWLGLTQEEYAANIEGRKTVRQIVEERLNLKRDISKLIKRSKRYE